MPEAPQLEAARNATRAAFHAAEAEEARFRVANAAVLFDEMTPGRDQAGEDLAADLDRLRATLARYQAHEPRARGAATSRHPGPLPAHRSACG